MPRSKAMARAAPPEMAKNDQDKMSKNNEENENEMLTLTWGLAAETITFPAAALARVIPEDSENARGKKNKAKQEDHDDNLKEENDVVVAEELRMLKDGIVNNNIKHYKEFESNTGIEHNVYVGTDEERQKQIDSLKEYMNGAREEVKLFKISKDKSWLYLSKDSSDSKINSQARPADLLKCFALTWRAAVSFSVSKLDEAISDVSGVSDASDANGNDLEQSEHNTTSDSKEEHNSAGAPEDRDAHAGMMKKDSNILLDQCHKMTATKKIDRKTSAFARECRKAAVALRSEELGALSEDQKSAVFEKMRAAQLESAQGGGVSLFWEEFDKWIRVKKNVAVLASCARLVNLNTDGCGDEFDGCGDGKCSDDEQKQCGDADHDPENESTNENESGSSNSNAAFDPESPTATTEQLYAALRNQNLAIVMVPKAKKYSQLYHEQKRIQKTRTEGKCSMQSMITDVGRRVYDAVRDHFSPFPCRVLLWACGADAEGGKEMRMQLLSYKNTVTLEGAGQINHTAVHAAVELTKIETLKLLLETGADPDGEVDRIIPVEEGVMNSFPSVCPTAVLDAINNAPLSTPLFLAIYNRNEMAAKTLLEYGALVNRPASTIFGRSREISERNGRKHINIEERFRGYTALGLAINRGCSVAFVSDLIHKYGADIRQPARIDKNPVEYKFFHSGQAGVRNIYTRSAEDRSTEDKAFLLENLAIADLLPQDEFGNGYFADDPVTLLEAVIQSDADVKKYDWLYAGRMVELLVKAGVDVNEKTSDGTTLVSHCMEVIIEDAVHEEKSISALSELKALVEAGAFVRETDVNAAIDWDLDPVIDIFERAGKMTHTDARDGGGGEGGGGGESDSSTKDVGEWKDGGDADDKGEEKAKTDSENDVTTHASLSPNVIGASDSDRAKQNISDEKGDQTEQGSDANNSKALDTKKSNSTPAKKSKKSKKSLSKKAKKKSAATNSKKKESANSETNDGEYDVTTFTFGNGLTLSFMRQNISRRNIHARRRRNKTKSKSFYMSSKSKNRAQSGTSRSKVDVTTSKTSEVETTASSSSSSSTFDSFSSTSDDKHDKQSTSEGENANGLRTLPWMQSAEENKKKNTKVFGTTFGTWKFQPSYELKKTSKAKQTEKTLEVDKTDDLEKSLDVDNSLSTTVPTIPIPSPEDLEKTEQSLVLNDSSSGETDGDSVGNDTKKSVDGDSVDGNDTQKSVDGDSVDEDVRDTHKEKDEHERNNIEKDPLDDQIERLLCMERLSGTEGISGTLKCFSSFGLLGLSLIGARVALSRSRS